jgi:hypothetical protein
VVLAIANPPDLVRPATHSHWHTKTHFDLCRKRSRRDLVWAATPAAKWAIAGHVRSSCFGISTFPPIDECMVSRGCSRLEGRGFIYLVIIEVRGDEVLLSTLDWSRSWRQGPR